MKKEMKVVIGVVGILMFCLIKSLMNTDPKQKPINQKKPIGSYTKIEGVVTDKRTTTEINTEETYGYNPFSGKIELFPNVTSKDVFHLVINGNIRTVSESEYDFYKIGDTVKTNIPIY